MNDRIESREAIGLSTVPITTLVIPVFVPVIRSYLYKLLL